jgi:beta-lactamase regulating signal transducer with metallopeptidase domain
MIPVPLFLEELARLGLQAVLNGFWQGLLLTAAVAAGLRLIRFGSAATRHLIWMATLLVVVALPLAALLRSQPAPAAVPAPVTALHVEGAGGVPAEARGVAAMDHSAARVSTSPRSWRIEVPSGGWVVLLLGFGLLVAAARMGRVVWALRRLRQLKRASHPLAPPHRAQLERVRDEHLGRAVELRVSERIGTPLTLGFLHPAILFPARLLEELRPEELLQVTLHELAHVRRGDAWTNLAQRLLEAVFFFHPAVYWIGRRLELERELACDDYVVAHAAGERAYARCLTRLAELSVAARYARLAPGAASRGSQLTHRVRALLAPDRARRGRRSVVAASLLVAGMAVGGMALVRSGPEIGIRAQERPSQAAAPSLPAVSGPERSLHELAPREHREDRLLAAPRSESGSGDAAPPVQPVPPAAEVAPARLTMGGVRRPSSGGPVVAVTGSTGRVEPLLDPLLPAPLPDAAARPSDASLACPAAAGTGECEVAPEELVAAQEPVLAGADQDPAENAEQAGSDASSGAPSVARTGGRGVNIGIAVAVPFLPRTRPARGVARPIPTGMPPQATGQPSPTMNMVEAIRGERVEVAGGIRLRIGGGTSWRSSARPAPPW